MNDHVRPFYDINSLRMYVTHRIASGSACAKSAQQYLGVDASD